MPDVELSGRQRREGREVSIFSGPSLDLEAGEDGGRRGRRGSGFLEGCSGGGDGGVAGPAAEAMLSVVVSKPEEAAAALKAGAPKSIGGWMGAAAGAAAGKDDSLVESLEMTAAKKGVPRSESYHEQCSLMEVALSWIMMCSSAAKLHHFVLLGVCQEESEEPLMDIGCSCRGELAKAHLSCIGTWFRTRGSNKCEICQQVAVNVPSPESQPDTNYWIWRIDPAFGGPSRGRAEHERGCFNPLWIAFCILIGGLLLDVLISVSFGVSALPVNIIIGALIVLGLGTAIRLALECCHEWNMQRIARRAAETSVDPHYPPDV